jgi:hypothetical protein
MSFKEIKLIFVFISLAIFLPLVFLDTSFSSDYDAYIHKLRNSIWYLMNTREYFYSGINFFFK